jgi:DNA-binding response OmpR family regulator
MKPPRTSRTRRARPAAPARPVRGRGRLLLVEPDTLTRWSITTYLERWFVIDAADCPNAAEKLALKNDYAAIVLADQLPASSVSAIRQAARDQNPAVTTVRTVTAAAEPGPAEAETVQLEKPFELAALARLLGVPEPEIQSLRA